MADSVKDSLLYQIVQYLKTLKDDDGSDAENIDTITSLIETTFNVEDNPDNFQALSYYPVGLETIYAAGVEKLGVQSSQDSLTQISEDSKFTAFLDLVTKKGFFDGAEIGSLEYLQRQAKLIAKYKERASKESSTDELEKLAEEKKLLGNTAIAAKEYDDAIRYYSEALEYSSEGPNSHIYYSNRAAAYCFLKNYELAAEDCESSILLKNDFSKAYSRLGLCNFHLGRYEQAVDAYERLVELEPENKANQEELRKAKKKLDKTSKAVAPSAASGAPDLSALAGMLGGNGAMPPEMSGLMKNPAMKQAMDKVGGQAGLASMMKDPQMMAMAQQMMSNPAMMQQAMAMMQGGGGADGMPDMAALAGMMGNGGGGQPSSSSKGKKKPFTGFDD